MTPWYRGALGGGYLGPLAVRSRLGCNRGMSCESLFTRWCQRLCVGSQLWTARIAQALHRQRSSYPIPPGVTGPTFKLLLNTALPWLAR